MFRRFFVTFHIDFIEEGLRDLDSALDPCRQASPVRIGISRVDKWTVLVVTVCVCVGQKRKKDGPLAHFGCRRSAFWHDFPPSLFPRSQLSLLDSPPCQACGDHHVCGGRRVHLKFGPTRTKAMRELALTLAVALL